MKCNNASLVNLPQTIEPYFQAIKHYPLWGSLLKLNIPSPLSVHKEEKCHYFSVRWASQRGFEPVNLLTRIQRLSPTSCSKLPSRRSWPRKWCRSGAILFHHRNLLDTAPNSSNLHTFFVELVCHQPVLDGFNQHFQTSVHFPLTSTADKSQQRQNKFLRMPTIEPGGTG